MNVGLVARQEPLEAALAAEKTSVVLAAKASVVSAAKKAATAATSAATFDISWNRHHPGGAPLAPPQGVVDEIEMSDIAADVAAVAAFLAADTTDVLAADTTGVLSAAKAGDGVFCPAIT